MTPELDVEPFYIVVTEADKKNNPCMFNSYIQEKENIDTSFLMKACFLILLCINMYLYEKNIVSTNSYIFMPRHTKYGGI